MQGRRVFSKFSDFIWAISFMVLCTSCVPSGTNAKGGSGGSGGGTSSSGASSSVRSNAIVISGMPAYNYGSVYLSPGNYADATFTITNNSNATVTALTPALTNLAEYSWAATGIYPGTGGTCVNGQTLAPAATCQVVVRLTPTTANPTALLAFSYFANGIGQQSSIRLSGLGTAPAVLTISPGSTSSTLNLGSAPVSTTKDYTFTLTNSGTQTATLVNMVVGGADFAQQSTTCGATLAVATSCNIVVRYTAGAVQGVTSAGSITLTYNNSVTGLGPYAYNFTVTSARLADHVAFTPSGTEPPSKIARNTNFSVTVAAIDSGGSLASYFDGTVQIEAVSASSEFGVVGTVIPGFLSGTTSVAMTGGLATFTGLQATTYGLVRLRPTVTASSWGIPAGANVDSNVMAVDLLRAASTFYTGSLLAYLPFDTGVALQLGTGSSSFVPSFGFRPGPWVTAGANANHAYHRDAIVLGEKSALTYAAGALSNPYTTTGAENIELNRGTVSFWFKTGWAGTDTTKRRFVHVTRNGGPVIKTEGTGVLYAGLYGMSETDISVDISAWTVSSWHHVVYRWDANAPLTYSGTTPIHSQLTVDNTTYNGRTAQWTPATVTAADPIYVGTAVSTGYSAGGVLAGFRVDDRPWTSSEVSSAYTGGVTAGTTGVHNHFSPDTRFQLPGTLGSVAGVRPYAQKTTTTSSAMTAAATIPVTSSTGFDAGGGEYVWTGGAGAVQFDGASSRYISLANPADMNVGGADFTIEAWIKSSGSNAGLTNQTILRKMTDCTGGSGTGGYNFYMRNDGRLAIDVCKTAATTSVSALSAVTVNDTKWHHVAAVVKQSTQSIIFYIDGVQDTTTSYGTSLSLVNPSAATGYIGGYPSSAYTFNGLIDNVRFFTTAWESTNLSRGRMRRLDYLCSSGLSLEWGFDDAPAAATFNETCAGTSDGTPSGAGVTQTAAGIVDYSDTANKGATSRFSLQETASTGAGPVITLNAPVGMPLFNAGAAVYKARGVSGEAINLVAGGDMEYRANIFPTADDAAGVIRPASMWYDVNTAALSGKASLHVYADNPCNAANLGLYCPNNAESGVYVDAAVSGDTSPGYLVAFDYKMVSGQLRVKVGSGNEAPNANWTTYATVDANNLTAASSTERGHFEGVYLRQTATTNYIYFMGASGTEFMMDDLKVIPLLSAADMEGSLPAGWAVDGGCTGTVQAGANLYHGGSNGYEVSGCAASDGLKSPNNIATTSGQWYTLSAWVRVIAGGVTIAAYDNTNTAYIAMTEMNAATGTNFARVSLVFQATSAQTQIRFLQNTGASDFVVDDVALYQIEPVAPTDARPQGATTFADSAAAPGADTCHGNFTAGLGTAPYGRITCGATSGVSTQPLGPGVSCAANSVKNTVCTTGSTPDGGTTDGSVLVDGSSLMTVPVTSNINAANFSISMWVKPRKAQSGTDSVTNSPPLFGIGAYHSDDNFNLWHLSTGLKTLVCGDTAGVPNTCGGASGDPLGVWDASSSLAGALSTSDWTHVVMTYSTAAPNTKAALVYKNADSGTFSTATHAVDMGNGFTGDITIGGVDSTLRFMPVDAAADATGTNLRGNRFSFENFDGWIDNVRTFDKPLTTDEILGVCNTEKPSGWSGTCGP